MNDVLDDVGEDAVAEFALVGPPQQKSLSSSSGFTGSAVAEELALETLDGVLGAVAQEQEEDTAVGSTPIPVQDSITRSVVGRIMAPPIDELLDCDDANTAEEQVADDLEEIDVMGGAEDIEHLRARLGRTLIVALNDGSLEKAAVSSRSGGAIAATETPPALLGTVVDGDAREFALDDELDIDIGDPKAVAAPSLELGTQSPEQDVDFKHARIEQTPEIEYVLQGAIVPLSCEGSGAAMAAEVPPQLIGTQENDAMEVDLQDDVEDMQNRTECDIGTLRARLERTLLAKLDDGSLEEAVVALSSTAGGATMSTEMPPSLLETQDAFQDTVHTKSDDGNLDRPKEPSSADLRCCVGCGNLCAADARFCRKCGRNRVVRKPLAEPEEEFQLIFEDLTLKSVGQDRFKAEFFQSLRNLRVVNDEELTQMRIVLREGSIIVVLQGPLSAASRIREEAAEGRLEVMGCCAKLLPTDAVQKHCVDPDDSAQLKMLQKAIVEQGKLDWFLQPVRPTGRPAKPRRPLGSLATTTAAFSEHSRVPRPKSSLQLAFKAIQTWDENLLQELVKNGAIKRQQLNSRDFVDSQGMTLMEAAEAVNNRPAINFFKKCLKFEPCFFDTPLLRREKMLYDELHKPAVLGKAEDVKIPSFELSYPLLPAIIKCGLRVDLPAQLEELVDSDNGSISRKPADPELLMHFASDVELPPGLKLDERSGKISGVPTEEVWDFRVEVAAAVGLGIDAAGKALCSLRFQCRMNPAGLTYGYVQCLIDPSASKSPSRLPHLSTSMPSQSLRDRTISNSGPTPTNFHAPAQSDGGRIEQFVILPALPHGLNFDVSTGVISGIPREKFRVAFSRTYEVLAYNSVGMTSCMINLEIIEGAFGMYSIALKTSGSDEQTGLDSWRTYQSSLWKSSMSNSYSESSMVSSSYSPSSARQVVSCDQAELSQELPTSPSKKSSWLGMAFPDHASEPDANSLLDKVAAALELYGTSTSDVPGCSSPVRAMLAVDLCEATGLALNSDDAARGLARLVEQQGLLPPACQVHPGKICLADGGCFARPGELLIYMADKPACRPAKPPTGSSHFLPPAPRLPAPELPSRLEREAAERNKAKRQAESQKVNAEFTKLVPSWHATLKAKAQKQRLDFFRRLRGSGKHVKSHF
eukprot:TRINITY_DN6073_c0_g1_i1.p1 TRINITY_DN6073_c0_g1~~TRINITY_DN6073_c0_g1_i1.p1  ORF type:complete len:1151 (+),score=245.99 TRINITY_DN6073_c0_g1_i1:168-3620(+)